MRMGNVPVLAPLSVGGAYFLRNRIGKIMAVMKPMDEEPFAVNNPREYRGGSLGMKNGKGGVVVVMIVVFPVSGILPN